MSSFGENTVEDIGDSVIRLYKRCNMKERLYELFTNHPHKNGMSYMGHWWRAVKLSVKMGYGSFCLLIHSIFPFLCQTRGTDMVKELYEYVINHKENQEENKKSE